MSKANNYIPALKFGHKLYPEDFASPLTFTGKYWYVDGDNGSDGSGNGVSIDKPLASLEQACSVAGAYDIIYMASLAIATGATDPSSYTENAVISPADEGIQIIGVGTGRTQGGLPQIKVGSTTTSPILDINASSCSIRNLGFNGYGATGGGILLDADASTKDSFGTTIDNCHFKNCVGTIATDCRTGGAIMWSSNGCSWQVKISDNVFYKNVGDVVLPGTSVSVPQDIVIEGNVFQSASTSATDCNLYLTGGGSGMSGLMVKSNYFGAQPALTSGSIALFMNLTGCYGTLADNYFGDSGTIATSFSATGSAAVVPTTVFMAGNYCETGLITR